MMNRVTILWTTEEKEVAMKVVLPYVFHGKATGWWDEISLIIWGPSVRLVATDPDVASMVRDVLDSNIRVVACKLCTDKYDVTDFYIEMGIETEYVGAELTATIKSGEKVLTF
jgi:hypothetical protein